MQHPSLFIALKDLGAKSLQMKEPETNFMCHGKGEGVYV